MAFVAALVMVPATTVLAMSTATDTPAVLLAQPLAVHRAYVAGAYDMLIFAHGQSPANLDAAVVGCLKLTGQPSFDPATSLDELTRKAQVLWSVAVHSQSTAHPASIPAAAMLLHWCITQGGGTP